MQPKFSIKTFMLGTGFVCVGVFWWLQFDPIWLLPKHEQEKKTILKFERIYLASLWYEKEPALSLKDSDDDNEDQRLVSKLYLEGENAQPCFSSLRMFSKLQELGVLRNAKLTNLDKLPRLPVQRLQLSRNSKLQSLKGIESLSKLEHLFIQYSPKLNDISELENLPSLKSIEILGEMKIAPSSVDRLRKLFPSLKFVIDGSTTFTPKLNPADYDQESAAFLSKIYKTIDHANLDGGGVDLCLHSETRNSEKEPHLKDDEVYRMWLMSMRRSTN